MATNIRVFGASPRWPVDVTAAAHGSGDLVVETGKFGIAVEANELGQPNTLIERCSCVLPVPSGVVAGNKIYSSTLSTTPANGSVVQVAPKRSAAVASTLDTSSNTNLFVGTAMTPAFFDGLTQVAVIELAPQ